MGWTRRRFIKTGFWSLTGLLVADTFWAEKFFIEINEFFLGKSDRNNFDIKVIQVSDLHLQSVSYRHRRLAGKLNSLRPDLILITGDAIDKAENLPILNEFLGLVDKNIRKVAILGNWEYWGAVSLDDLKQMYSQHNCDLLINESKQYFFRGKAISVTGVDDFVGGDADIGKALSTYTPGDYHVVLNHCPEYSDTISNRVSQKVGIDVILSGHTHGGQINFFGFVPFKPQGSGKYLKGWYDLGKDKLYVSKGIGTSIIPARFMSRAEIAVFNMQS